MNCVNHPEAAVSAYCQDCGKGLCSACQRTVQGNVYCEPCLAARMPGAPGFVPPVHAPNPGTAAVLGFIPGVGAMYNGQYIKAVVHVLVFVVLIGISEHYGLFGIFLAAWVFYQVFDAYQTAKARRDGLPLPDPFGLNELGNAMGGHPSQRPYIPTPPPPVPPPGATASPAQPYADWAGQVRHQASQWGTQAGQWGEQLRQRIVAEAHQPGQPFNPAGPPQPPPGAYTPPPPPGWVPPPVPPAPELERARREPIGAIILILLGMLFLFNTLGFFNMSWIGHGWPWIIVAIAVWLLLRNSGRFRMGIHGAPPPAPVQPQPGGNPPEPPAGGGQ